MASRRQAKTILGEYQRAREIQEDLESRLKEAKAVAESLKPELLEVMKRDDLASLKLGDGTLISRSIKKTMKVTDVHAISLWLDENPEIEKDAYYSTVLNETMAKQLAKNMLTRTGEILPGFEESKTEVLTLKQPKKEEF